METIAGPPISKLESGEKTVAMYLALSLRALWNVVFSTTVLCAGKWVSEDTEITDSGLGLSQYTCLLRESNCKLCF